MRLVVCAQELLEQERRARRPSHLLSLLSPGHAAPPLPAGVASLQLYMNDIAEPAPGLVAPDAAQMAELLAFARTWPGERPLLVHCLAGVSRSTAAALAIACQHRPDLDEAVLAEALRKASPEATPNPLMLALADELLGRQGRLAAAGKAIGRGSPWTHGRAFDLFEHLA